MAHDAIGFFDSQRLSLGLAMPLCPLRNDKSPDLLVRETTALDIDERGFVMIVPFQVLRLAVQRDLAHQGGIKTR